MLFHSPENNVYGYKANPTFARVHADTNPYLFVRGPYGSGKSTACVEHVVLNALKQKPDHKGIRKSRYLIIRATYPSLKTTIVKTWQEYYGDFLKLTFDTPFKGRLNFKLPDGTTLDCELNFLAVSSEDEVDKLLSYEVTGVHINEANEIDRFIWQTLKGRFGRYPSMRDGGPVDPFILCDYNSVDTEHWLYKIAEEEAPIPGHSFYVQPPAMIDNGDGTYRINPDADNLENLRPDYYSEMVLGNDPDFINVYILNNYGQVRSGRPVYKDYKDSVHAAKSKVTPLRGVPIIIGVDQGLTPAAVFCQLTPTGQLLILDEIVTEDMSLREFAIDILKPKIFNDYKEWWDNYEIVIDPAAVQRSQNDAVAGVDMFREAGLKYKLARTNIPAKRRDAVIFFLRKQDGLLISRNCPYLKKGFISEYKFEELRGSSYGTYKDKPAKNIYSHVHDALQYAALELVMPQRKLNIKKNNYNAASLIGGY